MITHQSEPTAAQLAYTVKQAAATLGVGRTTLYALIKAGKLTPVKVQTRTLLRHDDLLALLDRKSLPERPL